MRLISKEVKQLAIFCTITWFILYFVNFIYSMFAHDKIASWMFFFFGLISVVLFYKIRSYKTYK